MKHGQSDSQEPVKYIPWVGSDGASGYKCVIKSTGEIYYVYLNPSSVGNTGDTPNVFLYQGPHGDPAFDTPAAHLTWPFGD